MSQVLVIDDDPQIRRLLDRILSAEGHNVLLAPEGNRGLELVRTQPVDLVICDLVMPEKEGVETIREIRAHAPRLPIIAISGGSAYGNYSYLPLAQRLGATRSLQKPFLPAELAEVVREVLAGRQTA